VKRRIALLAVLCGSLLGATGVASSLGAAGRPTAKPHAHAAKCRRSDTQVIFYVRELSVHETLIQHIVDEDTTGLISVDDTTTTGQGDARGHTLARFPGYFDFNVGRGCNDGFGYGNIRVHYVESGTRHWSDGGTESCGKTETHKMGVDSGEGTVPIRGRRGAFTIHLEYKSPGPECFSDNFVSTVATTPRTTLKVPYSTVLNKRQITWRLGGHIHSTDSQSGSTADDYIQVTIVLGRFKKCGPTSGPLDCVPALILGRP
jgi:hypothetical protein